MVAAPPRGYTYIMIRKSTLNKMSKMMKVGDSYSEVVRRLVDEEYNSGKMEGKDVVELAKIFAENCGDY